MNAPTMTQGELLAQIATLQAANKALADKVTAQANRKLSFKVTAQKADGTGTNGAISVYGLGRFPITMYRTQWERLFAGTDDLKAFIEANASLLATKA